MTQPAPLPRFAMNRWRVLATLIYLAVGVWIFYWRQDHLFYLHPAVDSYNLDRWAWCFLSALLGFVVLSAFHWSNPKSPFPRYVFYYPFLLLVVASIVFSACHAIERTSGFVFYPLGFAASFTFAFYVDRFWDIAKALMAGRV